MNKTITTNLGLNLRKLRLSQGYTQQNIADILSINRSTYTYYETGKTQPSIVTIKKLALFYNTDINYILYGHEEAKIPDTLSKKPAKVNPECISELSRQEKTVIAQLRVLGTEDIALLIDELQRKLACRI